MHIRRINPRKRIVFWEEIQKNNLFKYYLLQYRMKSIFGFYFWKTVSITNFNASQYSYSFYDAQDVLEKKLSLKHDKEKANKRLSKLRSNLH